MYGIFLEEINHGVDGGLYGELIANRAFEDSRPPEGCTFREGHWKSRQGWDAGFDVKPGQVPRWTLVREGEARGSIHLETSGGLNENTPYCLRLDVEDISGGRIGIANEGFWGIGVHEGEKYDLVLHARSTDGFNGPLTARLDDSPGSACSQLVELEGVSSQWKQFRATLTATKTEPEARFVITAGSTGKIWFDFVSLFPQDTFRTRPNGLRRDIAEMIADLKPGFVRFPGGCVVEGGNIETAYNWKLTVGAAQERPERWNAWNYRRTHGMGLHEYLQFCEDLKAEPLFVGFAGQSCLYRLAEHVPMEEMDWVVSNFIDVVEYANGPADSTPACAGAGPAPAKAGGQLRARGGHPASFGLKFIEIGNENGMRQYEERYRLIHSKLKTSYPDITYIADYAIPDASYDMVDEHFYNAPTWFLSQFNRYDNRDRNTPPVYVGEIAVTSPEGGPDKGNLIAALAEGAFLMGLERNADVVRMVSYAPLLAHVKGRSGWHGMIYFDSSRVFGTVSYHLWKLFALNRPTYIIGTDVDYVPSKRPSICGAIGVGTWDTAAEFKEIRVEKNGEILYAGDFSKVAAGWTTEGGKWSVVEDAYRQSDPVVGLSYFGDQTWSDYTLTLKARKLAGAEGFLIVFGREDGNKYWWNLGGWGNREHGIEFNRSPVGRHVRGSIEANRWYDIRVELKGRGIRCYLDGKLVHQESAVEADRFFALAGYDQSSRDLILKVINTSAEPVTATLNLEVADAPKPLWRRRGVDPRPSKAQLTVLTSERPEDNNSLENPGKVVPIDSVLTGIQNKLTHAFPAYSLTVIRMKDPALREARPDE